jgi:DNA polymerase/3'-5' exonuclease PolX
MFDQAAELLEIKGDNPFRTRAYRRAARVIESLPKSAEGILRAGDDLTELPGIGEDLAGKIAAIDKITASTGVAADCPAVNIIASKSSVDMPLSHRSPCASSINWSRV